LEEEFRPSGPHFFGPFDGGDSDVASIFKKVSLGEKGEEKKRGKLIRPYAEYIGGNIPEEDPNPD